MNIAAQLLVLTRATGNSRFEMTKFPPPTEKFPKIPVSQIDSFCGYTRHKKAIRQAYRHILRMSTMLRNHLGRFWSQDVNETDQYLDARPDPLMSNIVCVVCPRGVFFL